MGIAIRNEESILTAFDEMRQRQAFDLIKELFKNNEGQVRSAIKTVYSVYTDMGMEYIDSGALATLSVANIISDEVVPAKTKRDSVADIYNYIRFHSTDRWGRHNDLRKAAIALRSREDIEKLKFNDIALDLSSAILCTQNRMQLFEEFMDKSTAPDPIPEEEQVNDDLAEQERNERIQNRLNNNEGVGYRLFTRIYNILIAGYNIPESEVKTAIERVALDKLPYEYIAPDKSVTKFKVLNPKKYRDGKGYIFRASFKNEKGRDTWIYYPIELEQGYSKPYMKQQHVIDLDKTIE
jgi:hypothetical protein